jgi:dodecin
MIAMTRRRPEPRSASKAPTERWLDSGDRVGAAQQAREGREVSVARVSEISSTSEQSFEQAIREGLDRANKTLRNVKSAWIKEQAVDVEDGRIRRYRVNMLVTFVLDD